MTPARSGALLVAWSGFLFGSMISIIYNVLAAFIPPHGHQGEWHPTLWAMLGAGVWPLALLLSVEVLARTRWPEGWFARVVRFGGVASVAVFSFAISYQHIRDVLISWNYPALSANVGPLVIDGLMIVSGYAMVSGSIKAKAAEEHEDETSEPEELPEPTPIRPVGEPAPEVPKPRPAPRVSALVKTRPRKTVDGKTNEEIVGLLLSEKNPDLTKRGLMNRFSIGAPRAKAITTAVIEAREAQQRKEES